MQYSDYVEKMKKVVNKYKHLPLYDFIVKVLCDCDHDLSLVDNIYINETVDNYPGLGVCYKTNDIYTICVIDDYGQKQEENYTDPYIFIRSFISAARLCRKNIKSK